MFLSDVSIKRPVFATMLMVALVVLGGVSFFRLAVDEYPDITYPTIVAQTAYPGASPEVVEREVSKPIEEALNTTEGLKEITSTSTEGSSSVRLQFNLGVDIMKMQPEVQGKVARIRRQLPRDIEEPVIIRFDPNDRPIMSIVMQSQTRPMRELTDLADEVIGKRIESIPGVGGVNVVGGTAREIRVELDPSALRAYGISPAQVVAALQRENQEVPAGRIQRGDSERLVRITGRVGDPLAFGDVTVVVRNGTPVRVRDVGKVVDGTAEKRSASLMGLDPALSLEVLKITGSNTVEVADQVRVVIAELQEQLPSDIALTIIRDDSSKIREALFDVELTLVLGAILTVMIIYLFLNSWRSTVITGLTLPVAIISSFFAMWMFGFTLNTMTLLALSLAIGLLIDDAIVVRENIVRHVAMGKDHHRASKEGTDEIGLAVFATTLAVIAVFIPVAFMGGMIGKIFFQFGVTVAFAVAVSLFVSFTLDPMLSSIWHDPEAEQHGPEARAKAGPIRRIALAFDDWFERLSDKYPPLLHRAIQHRWLVLGGAIGSVVVAFVIAGRLGFTFMPDYDAGEFNVSYRVTPGSRVEYVVGKGQALDTIVKRIPEVEFTYLTVGGGGGRGSGTGGQLFVRLKPQHDRDRSMAEIQNDLRPKLRMVSGARASIDGTRSIFGGFRQPIDVKVQGPEPQRLKLIAGQVLTVMQGIPGMGEPTSSDQGDIPQLDVRVDRQQAWAAGLGVGSIAATLQPLFTADLGAMEYYTAQYAEMKGVGLVLISSTGYTGAGGYEVYVPNNLVKKAWDVVFSEGAAHGIKPAGLAARDTLRLEMGFCLYGNDIDDTTSPLEAGLGWITKFTKEFTDSAFLKNQKEQGLKRKLVGFEMLDRGIPRHGYNIVDAAGAVIGVVTSGTQSPSLNKAIGMGYVPVEKSAPGSEILIDVRGKSLRATVVKVPFYKPA